MLISVFKTSGHSMEPTLKEGSFFLASSIPYFFTHPKTGDLIIFKNQNKTIVKKIVKIEKEKYIVAGQNLSDSMEFEPITRNDILGKVIFKF